MAWNNSIIRENESRKPASQPGVVGRVKTMVLILSVTVAKVCPGPITGGRRRSAAVGRRGPSAPMTFRLFDFRVRVAHGSQIGSARPGVQFAQQSVVARLSLKSGDAALRVVEVAENDGLGRTGLLASGLNLPVAHQSDFFFGLDTRGVNALHAVSALLHDPAAAHGHVGVAHQLQAGRLPIRVLEEIEPPYLVRAVV